MKTTDCRVSVFRRAWLAMAAVSAVCFSAGAAEPFRPNYDESKVPAYALPDPLVSSAGKKIASAKEWNSTRRSEVLGLFETHVYGRSPGRPKQLTFRVTSVNRQALAGRATRKEISVYFSGATNGPKMQMLVYLPNAVKRPVPAFLGLNFFGNHTIHSDPEITLSQEWMRSSPEMGIVNNRATEASRGVRTNRWPVEKILERGYALATIYYGDIEPDHPDGWKSGVRSHFRNSSAERASNGADLAPDAWGAIGAWAWGLSRAMDYFEQDRDIDHKRVAVMGHSRLGKTALWAGAQDRRFALVISNNSGCGGAALSRRRYGETVGRINNSFPHWFCGNFKKFNDNEAALPVDQHMLIALMAPRPVYIASAEEDRWADPKGEFLAAKHADAVYALFSKRGLGVVEMPAVHQPVGDLIGYHIRSGRHDVTDYDWERYLEFADRHLGK